MLTQKQKLIRDMLAMSANEVDDAVAIVKMAGDVPAFGPDFEAVTRPGNGKFLDDGREVIVSGGVAYALREDVHAQLVADALSAEQRRVAVTNARESMASIACPQMDGGKPCGSALNRAPVCPSCVTGRMGYKFRYTCESCGCDIVTREELT